MSEENKSSPPMSPTEAAKAKAQGSVPRGGLGAPPVVRKGPAAQPPTPEQQQRQAPPIGVPLHEFATQARAEQQANQQRSSEEVRSDMQRLAEGIKRHELTQKEGEEPEGPAEEETGDDTELLFGGEVNTDDLFNNRRYKKRIESRIDKMDIESLIMHGEVLQFVPIVMKRDGRPLISATFRSVSALEDLAIKKKFYDEEGPDRFMIDRYSLMNLCIGLKALNGTEQPPHFDENGKFDDKLFDKKFTMLLKKPHQLLALLVVNYIWFDERVRRLLVAEELGNG